MKNVQIYKKLIDEKSLSELDLQLHDEFNFNYDNNGEFTVIKDGNANTDEATELPIDELLTILNEFKKNGATHVEIEDHCDHYGYEISAWKITLATPKQIKEQKEKTNKKTATQKQIEIKMLKEKIKELES